MSQNPFFRRMRTAAGARVAAASGGRGPSDLSSDATYDAVAAHYASYDPTQAINQYAAGLWGQTEEGMHRNLDSLATSANTAGRLDTGYFDADQGQLYRDTVADYGRTLAQTSVQAEGMRQNAYDNYAGMVSARREERINAEREKAAERRARKRGILGTIGGALGAAAGGALGGPGGAQAGWTMGQAAGSSFA
jgi:hypothetical protein